VIAFSKNHIHAYPDAEDRRYRPSSLATTVEPAPKAGPAPTAARSDGTDVPPFVAEILQFV